MYQFLIIAYLFTLHRKSLQIIYFSFIRPLLEYGDVVWNNCAQYEAKELEKIQYKAARIVSGTTKLVSITALLEEVGWETLSSRRNKHNIMTVNGLCPDYLCSLVPLLSEILQDTISEMFMICKLYMQTHNIILIPFCLLLYVNGMNSPSPSATQPHYRPLLSID